MCRCVDIDMDVYSIAEVEDKVVHCTPYEVLILCSRARCNETHPPRDQVANQEQKTQRSRVYNQVMCLAFPSQV